MKKLYSAVSLLMLCSGLGNLAYADCFPACGGGPVAINWNGWSFTFVRPCATQTTTSGGRGGGLEIRNATFNGRTVLFKAHTPILNVKYAGDACGPYRDWQYEETSFICNGTEIIPGYCEGTATTNCANPPGGDVGTFCGVSVDRSDPNKLVLTTLLSAGWYRYQLEWAFFIDGSFRPSIKWTAVPAVCLNNAHVHYVYWRFDFDIEGSFPNTLEEFNNNPNGQPDPLFVEMDRMRDPAGSRYWRARNTSTNRAYLIRAPETLATGEVDGMAFASQISDIWALQYQSGLQEETDDLFGTASGYFAHLGRFIDQPQPASLVPADIVFWYSAQHAHAGTGVPPPCDDVNGPYMTPDPSGPAW